MINNTDCYEKVANFQGCHWLLNVQCNRIWRIKT